MPCVTIPTVPPAAANNTNNKEDKRTSKIKPRHPPKIINTNFNTILIAEST